MIYVDRSLVGDPPTLFEKDGLGKTETKDAIAFYSIAANLGKAFESYEAYKVDDVKAPRARSSNWIRPPIARTRKQ
jgi:hypothetical protein